ncbi:hypothetical protein CEXT_695401 [Caerostris extrusa]|uniref:Uncharacterized protein n=1 Tax=Caerostris extrusa TaxID=172846 RepID=A0AAV4PSW9_CAEEX|nr:hypothetical protein CEXT_695401 [Caerostris extrusa]
MRPKAFCEYLISSEVGFTSCQVIGRIYNTSKVYRQDIFLFTKGHPCDTSPAMPFNYDMWFEKPELFADFHQNEEYDEEQIADIIH